MTGKVHVEKDEIRQFLNTLKYPLYYLDFETFGPAIPMYDGTSPYQDIPFQFSLHVVENEASEPALITRKAVEPPPSRVLQLKNALRKRLYYLVVLGIALMAVLLWIILSRGAGGS